MADKFLDTAPIAATVEADASFVGIQTEGGSRKVRKFTRGQLQDLVSGGVATIAGVPPAIPAVNSNANYDVSSNKGFAAGQYIAIEGIAGALQVASTSGTNLVTLKNISATPSTPVTAGSKVVPSGPPGSPGAKGDSVKGDKGDSVKGDKGDPGISAFTTTSAQFTIPAVNTTVTIAVVNSIPFNVGDRVAIAGRYFAITEISSATAITIQNNLASQSGNVASGSKVQVSGEPGGKGDKGDAGVTGGTYGIPYIYAAAAGNGAIVASPDLATATTLTISSTIQMTPAKSAGTILGKIKSGAVLQIQKDYNNWGWYVATTDYASGVVSVTVDQFAGAIAVGDTVYLSILSAPSNTSGGTGGSGGATKITATESDVALPAGNLEVISDRATSQILTVNPSAGLDTILVTGKGTGVFSLAGGLFRAANGDSNAVLRRLATHQYASVLLKNVGDAWNIVSPASMTGFELIAGAQDTRAADIVAAFAAEGVTLSTAHNTALNNALAQLDAIVSWSKVVCWYPMMGGIKATCIMDMKAPTDENRKLITGTGDVFDATGFKNNVSSGTNCYVPISIFSGAVSSTSLETILTSVDMPNVSGVQYMYGNFQGQYRLTLESTHTSIQSAMPSNSSTVQRLAYPNGNPTKGNFIVAAKNGTGANLRARLIKNGTFLAETGDVTRQALNTTKNLALLGQSDFGIPGFYSVATMRNFIVISGVTLTPAQETALATWDTNLQTALGRN